MDVIRDRSGKLPILVIIIAAVVLLGGIGVVAFKKMGPKSKGKAHKEVKHVELTEWSMDEFIVNLADQDEPRYLKVNVVLGVQHLGKPKKSGGHGGEASNPEEAKARDAVISVLTRKRYTQLLSEHGKEQLKIELKESLNSVLKDCKVEEVYFTAFAMQ